jgi:hypothetical protein
LLRRSRHDTVVLAALPCGADRNPGDCYAGGSEAGTCTLRLRVVFGAGNTRFRRRNRRPGVVHDTAADVVAEGVDRRRPDDTLVPPAGLDLVPESEIVGRYTSGVGLPRR